MKTKLYCLLFAMGLLSIAASPQRAVTNLPTTAITNTAASKEFISILATNGYVCEVYGHNWKRDPSSITRPPRPPMQHCILCGKATFVSVPKPAPDTNRAALARSKAPIAKESVWIGAPVFVVDKDGNIAGKPELEFGLSPDGTVVWRKAPAQ